MYDKSITELRKAQRKGESVELNVIFTNPEEVRRSRKARKEMASVLGSKREERQYASCSVWRDPRTHRETARAAG